MPGFFHKLKENHYLRTVGVYAASALAVMHFSELVFPNINMPHWSVKLVVVLVLIGFPLTLLLTWAFKDKSRILEDNESLIVKEDEVFNKTNGNKKKSKSLSRLFKLAIAIPACILIIASGLWGYNRFLTGDNAETIGGYSDEEKSIAVLPFASFSSNPDDAYFSDGICDEILTQLAKISDLKVISRTSVLQYKNTTKTIRKIAEELGVNTILEGSVRKAGDKVRITVQLINAHSDTHMWAETYDRAFSDVFEIQSEVAHKIAGALKATLTFNEKKRIEHKPTSDLEAYKFYLKANQLAESDKPGNFEKILGFYQEAVKLDPAFTEAWCELSMHLSSYVFVMEPSNQKYAQIAEVAYTEAERLDRENPKVMLAKGYYEYRIKRDLAGAAKSFNLALQSNPNNADLYAALGYVCRRQGLWKLAYENLTRSISLNPLVEGNYNGIIDLCVNLQWLDSAKYWYTQPFKRKLTSEQSPLPAVISFIETTKPESTISDLKPIYGINGKYGDGEVEKLLYWFEKDYKSYIKSFQKDTQKLIESQIKVFSSWYNIGIGYRMLGNSKLAVSCQKKALIQYQEFLHKSPDDFRIHVALAHAYAALDEKQKALTEINRAKQLMPIARDAFLGVTVLKAEAYVYLWLGMKNEVISSLEHLIQIPGVYKTDYYLVIVKYGPEWNLIRYHPGFNKLWNNNRLKANYII